MDAAGVVVATADTDLHTEAALVVAAGAVDLLQLTLLWKSGKNTWLLSASSPVRGEGVAKVSGFVIFVPGAKADAEAKVKIKIERVSARFANASLVEGGSENVEDSGDETSEEQEETDSGDSRTDSDSMVERV